MEEPGFTNLLIVAAVAFAAPFLLGLASQLLLPAVVLEILAGIAVGPSGLGWVELDETLEVVSILGLAFLLFLGGLEIEFDRLRGRLLRLAAGGYAVSFALAVLVAFGLRRRRTDRDAAARRDHPLRHLSRRDHPGAQGLGPGIDSVRAARARGGFDRRLRRDHPTLAFLLRGGRGRLHDPADRRPRPARGDAVRRGARCRGLRPGSPRTSCDCRTPPLRSVSAARWCCSSASLRPRSHSASR
jgi:hypothetical protein